MPVRDGEGTIGAQLDALRAQEGAPPWELIVADNGSRDRTVAVVQAHAIATEVPCRVVDAADRPGVNGARNRGTEQARAALVVYCDADDVVRPGWLRAYADALDPAEPCVAAGPVLVDRLNRPPWTTWATELDEPFLAGGGLPCGWGANIAVHRVAWDRLGGFDEGYRYGYDELDLFARAHAAGVPFRWVGGAAVDYRVAPHLRTNARKAFRIGRAESTFVHDHPAVLPALGLGRQAHRLLHRVAELRRFRADTDHHALRDLAHDAGRLVGDLEALVEAGRVRWAGPTPGRGPAPVSRR